MWLVANREFGSEVPGFPPMDGSFLVCNVLRGFIWTRKFQASRSQTVIQILDNAEGNHVSLTSPKESCHVHTETANDWPKAANQCGCMEVPRQQLAEDGP
jgi:hypothetical protein